MTKILSTIGPVSQDQKNLKRIIKYSNFIRLNGAHNSISWHKKISENIKKINPSCKVLIDFKTAPIPLVTNVISIIYPFFIICLFLYIIFRMTD